MCTSGITDDFYVCPFDTFFIPFFLYYKDDSTIYLKNTKIGESGENAAVWYLVKQGFRIIERNIPNKYGEIDIVAKKRGIYYFYEVKTTWQGSWFNPADNMTNTKIRKFLISVEYYCLMNTVKEYRARALIVKLPAQEGGEAQIEFLDVA